jgi:superfamily II DNA or RNA helicase
MVYMTNYTIKQKEGFKMPKAIISNRILIDADPNLVAHIKSTLTYKLEKYDRAAKNKLGFEYLRTYKVVRDNVMSIPQGREDLIPEGYEIVDKRRDIPADIPKPLIPLRNKQVEVYNNVNSSCLILAKVGWGKTFCGLHIAYKLKQKTIIIVHTLALLDQWVGEVEKLFGFKPDTITGGNLRMSTPIVVGNIQSINKFLPQINDKFGTMILDECHHVAATTFSEVVDKMKSKYKIGLSGTMKRKDGKQVMFADYFSSVFHEPEQQDETLAPTVLIVKPGIVLHGSNWANKITNLLSDPDYTLFVAGLVKYLEGLGHITLIAATRVDFVNNLATLVGREKYVVITGETKDRQPLLKSVENGKQKGISATRSIISEGVSCNILSATVLCDPINNDALLEQLIGRIQRKHESKLNPVVIDINFSGRTERAQNTNRLMFYRSKGWEVRELKV